MTTAPHDTSHEPTAAAHGLSLDPFRALRPDVDNERLARLLCPPYDVIDAAARERLLAADADNAVAVILPDPTPEGYEGAARQLTAWVDTGLLRVDESPALYVYEMRDASGRATRGLMGAVELRAPEDGVILPHENTMAGPVADRLAVMTATGADLEPIYLVYDGGGAASALVRDVDTRTPDAEAVTPDGVTHRLWAVTDAADLREVTADLASRKALIADGHHRYATYRERQRQQSEEAGSGPWDRGLALIVDSSDYGPQVHAIHRVIPSLTLDAALQALSPVATLAEALDPESALDAAGAVVGFAAVLTDGARSVVLTDPDGHLADAAKRAGDVPALSELDVSVIHLGIVEQVWGLADDVDTVGYAHSVHEAIAAAQLAGGTAILLRPTPVAAVAAIAAAGARMPRKSTLFTPKPASGLVMRRLSDQIE